MRILIVTPSVPYPPNWGFGIRVFQMIRQLSREHQVSVLCYAVDGDADKVRALAAECHSVHIVAPPARTVQAKRRKQLTSMVSRRSFQVASLTSRELQSAFDDLLRAERFDVVQFESSQMCSLNVPVDVPWIVDEHNVEYELLQRMYQTERSPLRKLYNWAEFRKFRREEQASWRHASACAVTSDRERDIVAAHVPGQRVHVAPNGVDTEFYTPSPEAADPDGIVFTGLLSYRPNADAVVYFSKHVMPLIVAERPSAMFNVVGMGVTPEISRCAGPNVRIVGAVPDVRPHVHAASVFVAPLRMGSGTRLKILEAMSMGKAIVTTTVGCEGIDAVDGKHLRIADTPADMAREVVALLSDPAAAEQLGRHGRELVERQYDWPSIVHDLAAFHRQVVDA